MTEMTYDRKLFSKNVHLTGKSFYRKVIWPKVHMTESIFRKTVIWPKGHDRKVIRPKIHLTECFFWKRSFDRMFFSKKGSFDRKSFWHKVKQTWSKLGQIAFGQTVFGQMVFRSNGLYVCTILFFAFLSTKNQFHSGAIYQN
jgi:hypothetical protein